MTLIKRICGILAILFALNMATTAGAEGHSHVDAERCVQCAALPSGRRKYVAPIALQHELGAHRLVDAKLAAIKVKASPLEQVVVALPPTAPTGLGFETPPAENEPIAAGGAPRAPPDVGYAHSPRAPPSV